MMQPTLRVGSQKIDRKFERETSNLEQGKETTYKEVV